MMGFVEGHRKIGRGARGRSCRDYRACLPIDHGDFFRLGKIYKDARPRFFQLEGFRVGIKPDITNVVAVFSVDNTETAFAIADIDALSACIVTNVVGIIGKFDALDAVKRRAMEDIAGTSLSIRNQQLVEFRNET